MKLLQALFFQLLRRTPENTLRFYLFMIIFIRVQSRWNPLAEGSTDSIVLSSEITQEDMNIRSQNNWSQRVTIFLLSPVCVSATGARSLMICPTLIISTDNFIDQCLETQYIVHTVISGRVQLENPNWFNMRLLAHELAVLVPWQPKEFITVLSYILYLFRACTV